MKRLQNGNLAKLVAFFVIAIIITCTVSFAANGWQSFIDQTPDSDKIVTENNDSASDKIDENLTEDENTEDSVTIDVPVNKYYNPLTGEETDLNTSLKKPVCVVFDSNSPLYSISASYLTVEIPIEFGNTRLLCFLDNIDQIGKIGSIAPTRGYISNIAYYFSAIMLSYGDDDTISYKYNTPSDILDFSKTSGYCYTEYNSYIYTNADLVSAFTQNNKINTIQGLDSVIPYVFSDSKENITGNQATSILIKYSDSNYTEFIYTEQNGKYLYNKNGTTRSDLLNDKESYYDNVIILYADSTTYENESTTQLVLDTGSNGKGMYISTGRAVEITWLTDENGKMILLDPNGNKLSINRGRTYINFIKSSSVSNTLIS